MSEAAIARAGNRELDQRGAYTIPMTGVAIAGVADRTGCYRSHYIAIEYKQPGQHPRPNQRRQAELVKRAGGHSIIARSRQDVADLLDHIDSLIDSQEAA